MKHPELKEYCMYCNYLAPKGKEKLCFLGEQIAQRHLTFKDRLIGIVGGAGSGKSSLIQGMFPGLELSNDDDGVNPRKILQVRDLSETIFNSTTFHLDMRFQLAFTQMHEITAFVHNALARDRRVIVEHFDLLKSALGINADILIGIGEEIMFVRPNVFGPSPKALYEVVQESLKRRKMAHTVEHLAIHTLENELGISHDNFYSTDVAGGFSLRFNRKDNVDFDKLAEIIDSKIAADYPVSYHDERHIKIGDFVIHCNGPRIHIRSTGEITDFNLIKKFIEDTKTGTYCLVGVFGGAEADLSNLNKLNVFLKNG
jgi:hypothetical protein